MIMSKSKKKSKHHQVPAAGVYLYWCRVDGLGENENEINMMATEHS